MDYVNAVRDECEQKEYHLVMVFLRQPNADVYSCIKKLTCCEKPIPSQVGFKIYFCFDSYEMKLSFYTAVVTQVVTASQVFRGQMSHRKCVLTKILLQMAAKLGAELWSVQVPTHFNVIEAAGENLPSNF